MTLEQDIAARLRHERAGLAVEKIIDDLTGRMALDHVWLERLGEADRIAARERWAKIITEFMA
jgi:hypothetical protein